MVHQKTGEQNCMKEIRKLTYRDFYYISLDEFYTYVVTIMKSLNYIFYRRIKDTTTRRAEIWKLFDSDEYKILVWIEIQDPSVELSWQESADILRLMNDENLTKLFLFINGNLDEDARDILEDENHFIFTPRNIIEKLLFIEEVEEKKVEEPKEVIEEMTVEGPEGVIEEKKVEELEEVVKPKHKRRKFDKPIGHALLIEYFKSKEKVLEKTMISIEEVKTIITYIIDNYKDAQMLIDNIEDIDDLKKTEKVILEKKRNEFLPAIYKITLIAVEPEFNYVLEELGRLIKNIIYYISAIIDYDIFENIEEYKKEIEEALIKLNTFDDTVYNYMKNHVSSMRKGFENLIKYIFVLIIIIIIFALFL